MTKTGTSVYKTPITNINKINDEVSVLWETSRYTFYKWATKFRIANASDFFLSPKEFKDEESFTALAKTYKSPMKLTTGATTGFVSFDLQISPHKQKLVDVDAFMVGRQLFVVSCFFFTARSTSLKISEDQENVFGVPDSVQEFFNTGLLGALITTIIASVMWRLIASAFPMAFLSSPITYVLLRLCLVLEATGICNGAWVIAGIHKSLAGFQKDEVYIGTAEERAASKATAAESQGP